MSFVIPPVDYSANVKKYAWKTLETYDDKNPPVQNTTYTIMNETGGVRLVNLIFIQTNDETGAKAITLELTKDGTLWDYTGAISSITNNTKSDLVMITSLAGAGTQFLDVDLTDAGYGIDFVQTDEGGKPLEGHDIELTIKLVDAAGTNQRLKWNCIYELLEEV